MENNLVNNKKDNCLIKYLEIMQDYKNIHEEWDEETMTPPRETTKPQEIDYLLNEK